MGETSVTIGDVAGAAGVTVETVRFYEREGLIKKPPRPEDGYRKYPASVIGRIRFIKRAQELGFTLREIRELITLQAADCAEARELSRRKIAEIDAKVDDLTKIRAALAGLVDACGDPSGVNGCAILESLQS
jgi:MerR family mercuric resistance operon transcriptional regulator